MIVFLHGAGEVGDGSEKAVQKVRAHGIPKYFGEDADYRACGSSPFRPSAPRG